MIVDGRELENGELPINKIIMGDAFEVLKKLPNNCIDAVVTDPPYGLEFMNQEWDRDVPPVKFWKEVLRVMKHGAHLLSFFGTRTYHRGVVNIEDAGFEIRDMIQWIYSSGFPKGQAIDKLIDKELGAYSERKVVGVRYSMPKMPAGDCIGGRLVGVEREILKITEPATPEAKRWQGWGTSLKPACEPIVLARKPLSERNIAQNVLKWGTGGLNVGACRVGDDLRENPQAGYIRRGRTDFEVFFGSDKNKPNGTYLVRGRYPANVILDEEAAKMLDEQSGITISRGGDGLYKWGVFEKAKEGKNTIWYHYGDSGGASRFFYCAKAGRNERFAYCQDCDKVLPQPEWSKHKDHKLIFHTTVKPLKLIEYLVRLITPPNGIVLDPFLGSGTTAIACRKQGFRFIGIEIDPIYCKIAEHRLKPLQSQKSLSECVEVISKSQKS